MIQTDKQRETELKTESEREREREREVLRRRMVSAVLIGRFVFVALGFVTAITVLYTCLTDGTPFRSELLIPWMTATLIDFYVNVFAIAVWVWYKESSWASRIIWIILLISFGSITTSWYIALELFKMLPDDPVYLVLFKDRQLKKGGRVAVY